MVTSSLNEKSKNRCGFGEGTLLRPPPPHSTEGFRTDIQRRREPFFLHLTKYFPYNEV